MNASDSIYRQAYSRGKWIDFWMELDQEKVNRYVAWVD